MGWTVRPLVSTNSHPSLPGAQLFSCNKEKYSESRVYLAWSGTPNIEFKMVITTRNSLYYEGISPYDDNSTRERGMSAVIITPHPMFCRLDTVCVRW